MGLLCLGMDNLKDCIEQITDEYKGVFIINDNSINCGYQIPWYMLKRIIKLCKFYNTYFSVHIENAGDLILKFSSRI